jgi:phosphoglycolate phosphatase-like HAD superfamily hydrolase
LEATVKSILLSAVLLLGGPDPSSVLEDVLREARAVRSSGGRAVVIFDLDDTLFDPGPRNVQILRDLVAAHPGRYPEVEKRLPALTTDGVRYALRDTLSEMGVTDAERVKAARSFWAPRFFGSDYLKHDAANPGAVDYVAKLSQAGALVVYLTGRDTKKMKEGTEATLRAAGFPLGEGKAVLLLKPDPRFRDVAFKRRAVDKIGKMGTVVGGFDNEPANVNLLKKGFPSARIVFLVTRQSPGAPPVDAGIPAVKDFRIR